MVDDHTSNNSLEGLGGRVHVMAGVDDLVDKVADDLAARMLTAITSTGAFHLALSGGSTPKVLFQRLVIDPRYRSLPWEKSHIWQVDERVVGDEDEKRNWKMMRELLVDHIALPAAHAHAMPVLDDAGDERYEAELRHLLGERDGEPRLDYVLLGMGGDGHTASLFPQTPALDERDRWVVFNDGDSIAAPRPRMTMTYPLINGGRTVAALITGESKRAMLQRVALRGDDAATLPITGVDTEPTGGELVWYLDSAAAGAVDE